MSKRRYVKRAIKEEPEEVSLTEFNRSLLHLIKTKPNKNKGAPPDTDKHEEK
jgi:hypothetical protein